MRVQSRLITSVPTHAHAGGKQSQKAPAKLVVLAGGMGGWVGGVET